MCSLPNNNKLERVRDRLDPLLELLDGFFWALANFILESSFRLVLEDLDAHTEVEEAGLHQVFIPINWGRRNGSIDLR